MEQAIYPPLDLNPDQVLHTKLRDDTRIVMVFGFSAGVMVVMTSLLLSLIKPSNPMSAMIVLAALTFVPAIVFLFLGKKNERFYVFSTLLSQIGIGGAMYSLLATLEFKVSLFYYPLALIPGGIVLVFGCLFLYDKEDYSDRQSTIWLSVISFILLIIAAFAIFGRRRNGLGIMLAVCTGLYLFLYCAMIWVNRNPCRSVHFGMAVASFAIYLILIVIFIVAVVLAVFFNDDDNKSGSSGSSRSRSKSSTSSRSTRSAGGFGSSGRTSKSRGISFDPIMISSWTARSFADSYVYVPYMYSDNPDQMTDLERRKKADRFAKWLLVILAVVATAILMIAIFR